MRFVNFKYLFSTQLVKSSRLSIKPHAVKSFSLKAKFLCCKFTKFGL